MVGMAFAGLVTIVIIGFLWVFIGRPILEDFGLIARHSVSYYQVDAPHVMSRSAPERAPSVPSALETDGAQTDRRATMPVPSRAELLTLFRALRAAGMNRDTARAALKAVGLPLDNNIWADAAPVTLGAIETPAYVTPIVGRRTSATFETDPDYPYQAPA